MNKQLILKIGGIVGSALVLLTFASNTVYGMTLPTVYTVEPEMTTVPLTAKTTGRLDCESSSYVRSGDGWRISEVFVSNGDRVSKGDLLFTIDTRDLDIYKKTRELELLRLENSIDALDSSSNQHGSSSAVAPFNGRLLDVQTVYSAQRLVQGQVLGRFVDDSAFDIPFYFSVAYKDSIHKGMSVSVTLSEWMSVVSGTVESVTDSDYIIGGARAILVKVRISNTGVLTEGAVATAEISANGEIMPAFEPAALRYAREEYITAPISGLVTSTALNEGSRFSKGGLLLRMSPEAVAKDERAAQRDRAEIMAQLELARMQMEQFTYPPDGNVYAETDGVIFGMAVKAGDRPALEERLMSVLPDNTPLTVRFTLGAKEGADFGLDLPVSVAFYALQPDGEMLKPKEQKRVSTISSCRLSDDGSSWEYTAIIEDYDGFPLMDMDAEATIGNTGDIYMIVVPVSCITTGQNGPRVFVVRNRKGLFGDEFYVTETNVTVITSNSYVAALEQLGYGEKVIMYTSSSLMDGDTVRVDAR